jgi:isoquinoline 1-oxidoreductase beta subunit
MVSPGQNLARKRVWRDMSTGGSRGLRGSQDYMRQGGAAARTVLLQAAANQWGVAVSEVTVSKGVITHTGSGRKLSYGKVASAAAKLTPPDPKTLVLRDPRQWKIAGKPLKRVDTALKVMGKQNYAIDTRLPGMVYAAIQASPVFGGKLVSFDAAKLRGRKGIQGVYKVDDNAVAVVADNWWRAKMALQDLPIVWNEGANGQESSATIDVRLKEGLTSTSNVFADIDVGNAPQAIAGAAKRVEAVYSTPFVTHACMEPMNCTALVTDYRAEAWVASQNAEASMAALSTASGLPLDKCEVYNHTLGGGFGRRGSTQDFVRQATLLAKQMKGVPVKMVWSREEDMAQDFFRPIGLCKLEAGLDAKGNLLGLQLRVSGQSINAYLSPQNIKDGKDVRQLQGLTAEPSDAYLGYTVPSLRTEYAMRNTHVPVGAWRGVNTNQNGLYLECFMEEVAAAAGRDPLEFRRALMQKHPKHLAVLNAAADKAGWGKPLPAGVHRGIAQFKGYGSYIAAVAEVSVKGDEVKVHRLVLGTNCGYAVNPDQIAAQVEGSVAYAFDTLQSQSTVANGRMVNTNFDSYPIARLRQMPRIETVIAPTYDFWGGVGEPTICVVAPAILNAIFAATGKPMRNMPLKNHGLRIV